MLNQLEMEAKKTNMFLVKISLTLARLILQPAIRLSSNEPGAICRKK